MKLWCKVPLAGKVFLISATVLSAIVVAASYLLFIHAQTALRQEIRNQLQAVAATASLQVDPVLHAQIRWPGDKDTKAYNALREGLVALRKSNPNIRRTYTLRKSRLDDKWRYVVDSELNEVNKYHIRQEYHGSHLGEIEEALLTPVADYNPHRDKWGVWLRGYAPVRDDGGMVEAVVCLEMPADRLLAAESQLRNTALKIAIIALLIATILSILVTRSFLRPVNIVSEAAERVRNGELDLAINIDSSPELTRFANTFNTMISGLKESRQMLLEQSIRDTLTGLYNHMYFQERLTHELERANRYEHELCLLIIDLDRFKSINDTLGHPIGDCILHQLSEVMASVLRKIDIVSRYGGDEFAVILPETSLQAGEIVAESLRQEIEQHIFRAVPLSDYLSEGSTHNNEKMINITITVGMAAFPYHHHTREGLIMSADIALCRAKHISRNSICVYDPGSEGNEGPDPHELYAALHDPNTATIRSLAAAVDAKDQYTCGHSERVASYALQIGSSLNLDSDLINGLQVAGLLHDLGKIGVPDNVLNKAGGLTQEERTLINQHPSVGGNILRRAPGLDSIIPAVIFHHERYDGKGYPNGLKGNEIPIMARILAVADAFDAMTSERPYRRPMPIESAMIELRANAGKQFDPDVVEAFIKTVISETDAKQAA